eukprot:s340_g14.t1
MSWLSLESWCVVRPQWQNGKKWQRRPFVLPLLLVLHPGCQMFSRVFSRAQSAIFTELLHLWPDTFAYLISYLPLVFQHPFGTPVIGLFWIDLYLCSCSRYLRRALCFAF